MAPPDLRLTHAQYETVVSTASTASPTKRADCSPAPCARAGGRYRRGERGIPVPERRPVGAHLHRRLTRLPARHARRRGDDEIVGVWHSHTHTDAYPSPTDVRQAVDPAWWYVIVSLKHGEPVLRVSDPRRGDRQVPVSGGVEGGFVAADPQIGLLPPTRHQYRSPRFRDRRASLRRTQPRFVLRPVRTARRRTHDAALPADPLRHSASA